MMLRHFKQLYPYDELVLMVGSDMLLTFDQWYEYREILGKVTLAAISRCGTDLNQLYKMSEKLSLFGKTIVVNASAVTISSTKIRKMIKNNEDISCYLNGKVVKYIMLKNLYS